MTMQAQSSPGAGARLTREDGVALIIALMAMLLMSALGLALTLTTSTETKISSNYRAGTEAMYAADAAVERVMQDVLTVPDWNNIIAGDVPCCAGKVTSSFTDGPPFGIRQTAAGNIDLAEATNMVRCGKVSGCTDADMNQYTLDRPWGPNNPRWQLYAYGPMEDMIPTNTINSQMYVIVWMADDPAENDNNPLKDGDAAIGGNNPGRGVLAMLAHAYGPNGVRRVIEVTIAKTDTTEIERGYTGQRGQDEQNRRARKAAVQTPGKSLSERTLDLSSTTPTFGQ